MRWPLPALLGASGLLWVDALAGDDLAGRSVSLVVVASLAVAAGTVSEVVPLLAGCLAAALLLAVADQVGSPGRFALADDGVFYAVVVLAPGLAGWLLGTRRRQVAELEEHRGALEALRATAILVARAEEVERVERAVDVVLADRLRAIIEAAREAHRLAGTAAVTGPDPVPGRLAVVESAAREALGELRIVLGVLHAPPEPPPVALAPPEPPPTGSARNLDLIDLALVLVGLPLAVETSLPGHRGPIVLNVAAAIVQGVLLVLVRRRPLAGAVALLAVATAATATLSPLPPTVSWLLPGLAVSFLVGAAPRRRTALVGLVVILAGVTLVTWATPSSARALDGFAPGLVMGLLAWVAGRTVATREARVVELRAIARELGGSRDQAARLAGAEQRAELGRELHDVGAHALTAVCLQAGAAQTWWHRDRGQAATALAAVLDLADGTLTHLRDSLGGLAAGSDDLPLDVLAGLGRLLGLSVVIRVDGDPRALSGDVAQAAFRVVQEALTNAARHARHASVEVGVVYAADSLDLRVTTTGPGHDRPAPVVSVPGSGLGLRGMRERVEAVRGELTARPDVGGGFLVHAHLPLVLP